MKFFKILAVSTLISTSFAADVAPNAGVMQANPFRGNWMETFQTTTPLGPVIHTPTHVSFGHMQVGRELRMSAGSNFNGYRLLADLILRTDSTREEFVQALQRARIYSGNYNGAQQPAAQRAAAPNIQRAAVNDQKAAAKQAAADRKAEAAVLKKAAVALKKQTAMEKKAAAAVNKQRAAAAKKATAILKKESAAAKKAMAKQAEALKKQQVAARKVAAKQLAAARRAVRV